MLEADLCFQGIPLRKRYVDAVRVFLGCRHVNYHCLTKVRQGCPICVEADLATTTLVYRRLLLEPIGDPLKSSSGISLGSNRITFVSLCLVTIYGNHGSGPGCPRFSFTVISAIRFFCCEIHECSPLVVLMIG